MRKYSLSALVAAGLLAGGMSISSSTSAFAADLGGNCCADLEERIAELEATTARKGNRKVSLTVSGWVGQQVMFWDDGGESNVYVHDLGTTLGSHVKFTGQATIVPGWSAGYVLHLEAMGSDSLTQSQNVPVGPDLLTVNRDGVGNNNGVGTLQSFWFIKSDQLGKVSVGKQSQASDNTAILVDGSGSLVPANWVSFDVNSFFVRNSSTGNLSSLHMGRQPAVASGVTATACRPTRFATTRRPSAVSRCRHHGVKTTSGMSPLATPANGPTSRSLRQVPSATYRTTKWACSRATWHSLRVATTSRPASTSSISRRVCSPTVPTVIWIRTALRC